MNNFTKMFLAACMLIGFALSVNAQSVGINNDGTSPNSKAMLDVSSTTKGLLPPRMTYAQKSAIVSPPAGLIVWCSNCGASGELQIYNGSAWTSLTAGTASGLPDAPTIGTATAGNGEASVTFSAPGSNGGSVITLYTATSNPGGSTGTSATAGTITVTGLTNGTAYTFTVTATTATGTGAASAASNSVTPLAPFVCGISSIIDSRDGKEYPTVQIDAQCWMAKNLNVGTRIDVYQTNNGIIEKFCYSNLESFCDVFGGLYQWNETMQYSTTPGTQGICPIGWHLPTDDEWTTLSNYLEGESVAGGKMKETGLNHWTSPNTGATNSSGFTGIAGGFFNSYNNAYSNYGPGAYFWSTTQVSPGGNAWSRGLNYITTTLSRQDFSLQANGLSVRCLKDN